MKLSEAMSEMQERYGGADWPRDWYSMEMDLGWAFVSPNSPGLIVVVANNRSVDQLRYKDSAGATGKAKELLRSLQ
jgi:hypothetical protein